MSEVFTIAEAGVNHNGSLEVEKKLIDVAVDAGAYAVKFQTFRVDKLVTANADKARWQIENTGTNDSQIKMLRQLELSSNAHKEFLLLIEICQGRIIRSPLSLTN